LKRLTILKAEIKENNTHETQIEEDYSDSTWTASEFERRLKECQQLRSWHETQNKIWAPWESALRDASTTAKKQQKELKKRVDDLKKQQKKQRSKSMLKLDKLMKGVQIAINPVLKQLVWKLRATKSRFVYSQGTQHQTVIDEPFQKTTCHLSFWVKWKHFRTRFSENMISMNCAYTQTIYWERQQEIHTTDHTEGRA
jgi:ElaB/YqjD/DUF883 family membrane-anchored ribosome-binding protein